MMEDADTIRSYIFLLFVLLVCQLGSIFLVANNWHHKKTEE